MGRDHALAPDPEDAHADLLIVVLDRRGLRARRTGASPPARLDPPRRGARRPAAARVEVNELLAALQPLIDCLPTAPDQVVVAVHDAEVTVDPLVLVDRLSERTQAPSAVLDTVVATLFGALGGVHPGTVVELGVMIRGFATDLGPVWHRIDGWGPLLGDRGSAAWIGAQGLSAALRARDGVPGGSARLLQAGRRAYGDEAGWPRLLRENPAADVLADFASMVGELALTGDDVSRAIIALGGEHVADALAAGLRLVPGAPITATGELLLIDAVKLSVAAALGARAQILVPALGDALAGAAHVGEHLAAGRDLPHRPPFVYTQGQEAIRAH